MWGPDPLSEVSEDELLAALLPDLPTHPDITVGPGDDAALLEVNPPGAQLVVTTDSMVLGRDWRDDWSTGEDVGHKIVAQNLADIAAMGATPTGILIALAADPAVSRHWVAELMAGIADACRAEGVGVLGGDVSSAGPGAVMVAITALGVCDQPVRRDGARPGDIVAINDALGRAAAGLVLLQEGRVEADPAAVQHQRRPSCRVADGASARDQGSTSLIDISDGLLRDLSRVAKASGVSVRLDHGSLAPLIEARTAGVGLQEATRAVYTGGEEHTLLATFPQTTSSQAPTGWRAIGRIEPAGSELIRIPDLPKAEAAALIGAPGWDHFRR